MTFTMAALNELTEAELRKALHGLIEETRERMGDRGLDALLRRVATILGREERVIALNFDSRTNAAITRKVLKAFAAIRKNPAA
jgi:hypothetical protein